MLYVQIMEKKNYAGAQIHKAYVAFLSSEDPFAIDLKNKFLKLTVEEIARKILKVYYYDDLPIIHRLYFVQSIEEASFLKKCYKIR